ncbi:Diphthine synthase [uncultured archaeon]|nr:Diphthine synthase [uncultured archaeon]
MLFLIGLGLNADSISEEGLNLVKKCKKIYLENYTVELPYSTQHLEEVIGKKLFPADREFVESLKIIDEARKLDVALLIYGNPLMATTHITMVQESNLSGVKCKVVHNATVLDAVGVTGLQIYKFGKIASMPKWDEKKKFTPDSFMKIVKENSSIGAHSLILVDIGLQFPDALNELKISAKNQEVSLSKIIVGQQIGTKNQKILYRPLSELEGFKGVKAPFCFILPGKLHFVESEYLESFQKE